MPHGLTIDQKGNIWLTDVAMHQVGNKLLAVELFYVFNSRFNFSHMGFLECLLILTGI